MKSFKRACLGSTAYALAVVMGAAVAVPAVATVATAQDYTSGGIVGTVVDVNGNPVSGASVTLHGKYVPHFKPGKELRERVNESMSDHPSGSDQDDRDHPRGEAADG